MKNLTIIGARPQFIKAAAVSRVLRSTPDTQELLVHTGQHYDDNMSSIFFRELDIPQPDINLGINSNSHGAMTGRMLESIEQIILKENPDFVLVYGDTNSTLAGALAAAKLHVPVAHVEAGLRSFNRRMPEEINRILTDHVSELLFAPTDTAVTNLTREAIAVERIHQVGDVMYDAALYYQTRARKQSRILQTLELGNHPYILATIHRAENTDDVNRLHAIIEGLAIVGRKIPVVFPLHPRTRAVINRSEQSAALLRHLRIIDPVGYLDMVMLEMNATLIATDSGGVQKEAFFHGVPCVTLREETEWVELVHAGWNRLCPPTSANDISQCIESSFGAKGMPISLYGQGDACTKIVNVLKNLKG